jgi:hypothetical protein
MTRLKTFAIANPKTLATGMVNQRTLGMGMVNQKTPEIATAIAMGTGNRLPHQVRTKTKTNRIMELGSHK